MHVDLPPGWLFGGKFHGSSFRGLIKYRQYAGIFESTSDECGEYRKVEDKHETAENYYQG